MMFASLLKKQSSIFTFTVFAIGSLLVSCNSESEASMPQTAAVWDTSHSVVLPDTSLILDDYVDYFGRPNQVTHKAFVEGTKEVHFLYKPVKMECLTALDSWSELDSEKLDQTEKIKEGYQFFEIWYKDNQLSVTQESAQKEALQCLLEKATIIANVKDTLDTMKELFKSSVAGQPSKILLVIPDVPQDSLYKISANGCGMRDFELEISKKQIQSLPRLKI